ncbi:MAG: hypothetical protein J7M18_08835 [Candidatus Eremiobacteraeota bacterium]|nr:hypothetical protein [Candidatus Eremiobacteraeota bacterium]
MSNFPSWYMGNEERCAVCGRLYPLCIMVLQDGVLVCPDCRDESHKSKEDES